MCYEGIDFKNRKAARVYDSYLSFMHNSLSTRAEAMGFHEFCESPIYYFHVLQRPGTMASILMVRGTFDGAGIVASGQQHLCVACTHNHLLKCEWGAEEEPFRVSVQPIV